jgi:hypothetical protein
MPRTPFFFSDVQGCLLPVCRFLCRVRVVFP